jgi:hypothetical protein
VSEKKKTGLGTSAFFKRGPANGDPDGQQVEETSIQPAQAEPKPKAPPKPKKVRTTILIYPETLASMELLKVEARKKGDKATLSDIIEEAVQGLMKKKKLELR